MGNSFGEEGEAEAEAEIFSGKSLFCGPFPASVAAPGRRRERSRTEIKSKGERESGEFV